VDYELMGYGRRALVVDDDENMRNSTAAVLEEVGFAIMLADNGLQALDEMRRRHFDVVITDCQMPWMNGLEFLNHSRVFWPDTPVIIVSGLGPDGTELGNTRGAFAWIQKPYDARALYQVLDKALRYRRKSAS